MVNAMMIAPALEGDVADKIRELRRTRLELSQSKFAVLLGLTTTTISAWETNLNQPSAEHYIKMGNMSPPELAGFFYRKAGLDMQCVERALAFERARKSTKKTPRN